MWEQTVSIDLRDVFAGMAMQSYMRNCTDMWVNGGYIAEPELPELARLSYQIADAMVEARAAKQGDAQNPSANKQSTPCEACGTGKPYGKDAYGYCAACGR